MQYLKLVCLMCIVSIFAACEGGTTFEKDFVNNSSETITIDMFISSLTSYQETFETVSYTHLRAHETS